MLFLNGNENTAGLTSFVRLTVTNVVFELYKKRRIKMKFVGLTVTNVVFEYKRLPHFVPSH